MSVIVTNAKNRIAYNVVRSLGEKGINVYTADFVRSSMSFASRYSKGHFIYPSPFRYQEEFIECIIENIRRLKAKVIIPVYEETFLMAKHKGRLSKYVKMVIPDYDQILIAHNKDRWGVIAERLQIPVPKSYTIEALKKKVVDRKTLRYPVLIKPKQGGGGWAITQVSSPDELERILDQETNNGLEWERFFIQEKIEGEIHCVAMLFCKGEYRAKVTYKQIRDYPVAGGQATLRVSLSNEAAERHLKRMLEYLQWHGICQADFIVDKNSGTPYLIDINPRLWGSLAQGIASGVDFPYLLYKIAIDGDVKPLNEFKTGVVTRWIGGDIRAFLSLLKTSEKKLEVFRKFFFLNKGAAYYDDFCLNDPLPFFTWTLDILYRTIKYRSISPNMHDSLEGVWE